MYEAVTSPRPLRSLFVGIVFLVLAVVFVERALVTRFFGAFTIVTSPYYHELVTKVVEQPAFVRRLGPPIVVDDAGVWCPSNAIGAAASTSQCHLPVRGSRATGDVFAQTRYSDGVLHADLTLSTANGDVRARL